MKATLYMRVRRPACFLCSCKVDERAVVIDDTVQTDTVRAVQLAHDTDAPLIEVRVSYELNQVTFFHGLVHSSDGATEMSPFTILTLNPSLADPS
jgi:hypothetical protein